MAHKLVDLYSDQAISWYAVGCYYDLIGKSDPARRYLTKATSIDRLFGPAWLAYGHSFAKENEHDQVNLLDKTKKLLKNTEFSIKISIISKEILNFEQNSHSIVLQIYKERVACCSIAKIFIHNKCSFPGNGSLFQSNTIDARMSLTTTLHWC